MPFRHPKIYNFANLNSPPENKKGLSKVLVALFLLIILVIGIIYLLLDSKVFTIKNIIFVEPLKPEITSIFDKLKGKNIFLFSETAIQKEISEKYPDIADLEIQRGLPDTIRIQFRGRSAKLVWQTQEKKYLVSETGEIYKEADDSGGLPIVKDNNDLPIEMGQMVVSENFEQFIAELNQTFAGQIGFMIIDYEINETIFQVEAITDQGWKIIFDTTGSVSDQLSDLKKFLATNKNDVQKYVDLRVPGKVYYQ